MRQQLELVAVDAAAVHPAERHRAISVCGPSYVRQTRAVPPIGCPIALRGKHAPDATGGDAPGATSRVSASASRHPRAAPGEDAAANKRSWARIVLRPIGNPLPLGFLALAGATLVVSGLQLDWLQPADGKDVALILIAGLPTAARDAAGEYCLALLGALAAHALGALEELGMLGVASARGTRVRAGGETRLLPVV
jgi:hypothetical protein